MVAIQNNQRDRDKLLFETIFDQETIVILDDRRHVSDIKLAEDLEE
jgi:hypothetical protein